MLNSIPKNFYLKLFFIGFVSSAASSPKYNVFCYFSILYFNYINLSSPLAPLGGGEIDICTHGPFYTKFNFQQLLSEAFFHGMCIFGVGILCVYWHIIQTMLTAMMSLYVAPCKSSPPVFLYSLTLM